MTAALEGGERSAPRPGRTLPQKKTRYPFYRKLDVPQGRSGQAENFIPTGIRSRTMTAALERGEWSAARPDRTLPPGETRYPFYRRLGGPQGRSGQVENLIPTGIRSRTVQPVAQSIYRLSYPAHIFIHLANKIHNLYCACRVTVITF